MNLTQWAPKPVCETTKRDEREWIALIAAGNRHALAELVEQYQARVVRLAGHLLGWQASSSQGRAWQDSADDVAQDVFLTAWQKASQYRAEAEPWTWLAAITTNRCRALIRRRRLTLRWLFQHQSDPQHRPLQHDATKRDPVQHDSRQRDTTHCDPAQRDPSQQEADRELAAQVRRAVAQLPIASREVIVLKYFEHMTTAEIAQVLGSRAGTIDVRISRARKQLESLLQGVWDNHRS